MEISNRKLLSRGVVAIGLVVAVSGVPGEGVAGERPDLSPVTWGAEANPLTEQKISTADKQFALQDELLGKARKFRSEEKFKEAVELYEQIMESLNGLEGSLADTRRETFGRELAETRRAWADNLIARAYSAMSDKRYNDALAFATEIRTVDPALQAKAEAMIEEFQKKRRNAEVQRDVSLETAAPSHASDKAKISLLLREAQVFYDNNKFDEARNRAEQVFLIDPYDVDAIALLNKIYRQLYSYGLARHEADTAGMVAYSDWSWAEPVFSATLSQGPSDSIQKQASNQGVYAKMERIVFPTIAFDDADIMAVIRFLNNRSKTFDPDKEGVNIATGMNSKTIEQLGRVTMNFTRIPMSEVLRYICQDTGLKYRIDGDNVFIGPEVDEMQVRNFQIRGDLISSITDGADAAGDGMDMGGGPMGGAPAGAAGGGGAGAGAELGVAGGATDAKTFLTDASAGQVRKRVTEAALKKYFGDRGVMFFDGSSISYDKRSGRLSVKNTPENLRRLDELIRQLDAIEKPLIMVEIKGIEVSEEDLQELGFDWSMSAIGSVKTDASGNMVSGWLFGQGGGQSNPATRTVREGITEVNTALIDGWNFFPSLFGNVHPFGSDVPLNISLTINALSRNTRTETLAAPKVMTSNDRMASVRMVKSYQFPEDWDAYEIEDDDGNYTITAPVPSFGDETDIGIIFDVTPKVNADNYTITLEVNPTVTNYIGRDEYNIEVKGVLSEYVPATNSAGELIGGTTLKQTPTTDRFNVWKPIISRRNVKVNVNVYDGETIVLGGMIDATTTTRTDKWPILGDLPLVGRFFQSQSENIKRNNLLLFVTTRLVGNDGVPIRRNRALGAPDFNR
ncbi:hypothetical protein [Victivallis vadensis]|uniref:hypothetical protein n=1 Tax=Victivallis vadensis TaxID=172901 RepID=UPI0023F1F045|nr:hypothetical protein [Victivallis vadensis]